jgi:hypothetical protein
VLSIIMNACETMLLDIKDHSGTCICDDLF